MRRRELDKPCPRCREEGVLRMALAYDVRQQLKGRVATIAHLRVWICSWHNTEVDWEKVQVAEQAPAALTVHDVFDSATRLLAAAAAAAAIIGVSSP